MKKTGGNDERTTAKTERMKRAEVTAPPSPPAKVGSAVWVLHDDHPQGYEVSVHASELGVYDAALVRIHQLVDDGEVDKDYEDVIAAIEAKDGKAALEAFDAIISEDGDEATGRVHLWVSEQKIER